MAFTSTEANKCIIKKVNKILNNGAFQKWSFSVIDSNGRTYQWEETNEKLRYISTPTDAQIKTYIHDYLSGGSYAGGGGSFDGVTQIASLIKEDVAIPKTLVVNQTVGGDVQNNLDPPT